ncbi:fungal-specific transcription factor domain-containing protein [Aspergillus floccosus]
MATRTADNASTNVSTAASRKRPAAPDSGGSAPQNRRRDPKVSRACDSCKAKKIRCSGTLPCDICTRRRLPCSYASKYSRGRPPTPLLGGKVAGVPISGDLGQQSTAADILSTEGERNQPLTSAGDNPFLCANDSTAESLCGDIAARDLVRFYFDTCAVTYRLLHRQTTEGWLQSMLEDRRQGHPLSHSVGHARSATIFTILAIATFRKSKINDDPPTNGTVLYLEKSDHFFCSAMRMTDSEVGFPRLESAQARLIQVLYLLQTSRMNKAWYTFGRALQIISSLGLHRRRGRIPNPYSKGCPDYISLQCGRRVFWVAYIIDKYLSVVFGRPRLLHDDEVDQDFPDSMNDEDMVADDHSSRHAAEECHIDSLIFHARIAKLIGRVSRNVYSTTTEEKQDRVASACPLINELHAWRASLPPHLGTVRPSTLVPSFRREAIALQLAYSHALIHANRPFLLGDGSPINYDSRVRDRINECISAARKTLELVEYMAKDPNLFHSFWWTHYATFCALAVVYVWQIRSYSDDSALPRGTHVVLDELAERCHSHLHKASSAASPSRRYGIILDEMRLEAKRQITRNPRHYPLEGMAIPDNEFGEGSNDHERSIIAGTVPEGCGPFEIGLGGLPDLLQSWQTTDWLDLDSSAFYPVPEYFDLAY